MVINHPVSAYIGVGVARDRIILAVELSGPFAVNGAAVLINSIDCDLDLIAGRFVNNGVVSGLACEL